MRILLLHLRDIHFQCADDPVAARALRIMEAVLGAWGKKGFLVSLRVTRGAQLQPLFRLHSLYNALCPQIAFSYAYNSATARTDVC